VIFESRVEKKKKCGKKVVGVGGNMYSGEVRLGSQETVTAKHSTVLYVCVCMYGCMDMHMQLGYKVLIICMMVGL
jgi:hypothetical protein